MTKGITEINAYLRNIQKKVEKDMIQAQREIANEICKEAQNMAPGQGIYASSIKVRDTIIDGNTITTPITTDVNVMSKINGKTYNLGFLLENGTNPHLIRPIDAQALHFQIDGEDIFTKLVHHPGFVEMPHFIPALENNKEKYLMAIGKVMDKEFK